jgi:hypothetical protein
LKSKHAAIALKYELAHKLAGKLGAMLAFAVGLILRNGLPIKQAKPASHVLRWSNLKLSSTLNYKLLVMAGLKNAFNR